MIRGVACDPPGRSAMRACPVGPQEEGSAGAPRLSRSSGPHGPALGVLGSEAVPATARITESGFAFQCVLAKTLCGFVLMGSGQTRAARPSWGSLQYKTPNRGPET